MILIAVEAELNFIQDFRGILSIKSLHLFTTWFITSPFDVCKIICNLAGANLLVWVWITFTCCYCVIGPLDTSWTNYPGSINSLAHLILIVRLHINMCIWWNKANSILPTYSFVLLSNHSLKRQNARINRDIINMFFAVFWFSTVRVVKVLKITVK